MPKQCPKKCWLGEEKSFGTAEGVEGLAVRHKSLLLFGLSCRALTGREACVSCAKNSIIIAVVEHLVLFQRRKI